MISLEKLYFYLYLGAFILLSIPAIKLVPGVGMSQVLILLLFFTLLVDDFLNKNIDYFILIFFLFGATIMTLISFNSMEAKFGEYKFIIKYFIVFPATYYTGSRMLQSIELKKVILLLEIVVFIYCLNAFLINFAPIPKSILDIFVSYRTDWAGVKFLDYQGTFFEAGWFGMGVASVAMSAILLRYEYKIYPKDKTIFFALYGFVVLSLFLSKNKTVWIALILILLSLTIVKIFVRLIYSNQYMPQYLEYKNHLLKLLSKIDVLKIIIFILLFIILFFIINSSLDHPIISAEILKEKMEKERGKVFTIIMGMLKDSSYFGGYGFGFVEAFFTTYDMDVIGLGKGTGMVFNSYLDIWLSASIFGLLFHILLIAISMSSRNYFSMVIPLYFIVFANFNPAIGSLYYYLFMGLSYSVAKKSLQS